MLEKNIDIGAQFPKGLESVLDGPIGIVINMSGQKVPAPEGGTVEEWKVLDPIGMSEDVYREVANEIEQRVMRLVLGLRGKPAPARRI
jgi:protein-tyrosine-phosphatase